MIPVIEGLNLFITIGIIPSGIAGVIDMVLISIDVFCFFDHEIRLKTDF
jgi:hypothetical protein